MPRPWPVASEMASMRAVDVILPSHGSDPASGTLGILQGGRELGLAAEPMLDGRPEDVEPIG